MIPRHRLDITLRKIAHTWLTSFLPSHTATQLTDNPNHLITLSARSGFDALLSATNFPAGSEVLMSSVTIADMQRIVEAHNLIVIPLEVNADTLSISLDELAAKLTPNSRMIVFAHLFGSRTDLKDIQHFATSHQLLLVEDCAQSFRNTDDLNHQQADVSLYSFGPIKTATTLGGGLLTFRNTTLAQQVRQIQHSWPTQTNAEYRSRLMKYFALHLISNRFIFTLIYSLLSALKIPFDHLLNQMTRSFPGNDFFQKIQRQPAPALRRFLTNRLSENHRTRIEKRTTLGHNLQQAIPTSTHIGSQANHPTHWVFPIHTTNREQLRKHLLLAGYDATSRTTSLTVLHNSKTKHPPENTTTWMNNVLFLPLVTTPQDRDHLANILTTRQNAVSK